jgi:hypothetical protein
MRLGMPPAFNRTDDDCGPAPADLRTLARILAEGPPRIHLDYLYTFHADPGHGWLEVPHNHLTELGIAGRISGYSYREPNGQTWYLEEDCDAATFAKAFRTRYGDWPRHEWKEWPTCEGCEIRHLPRGGGGR